MQKVEVPSTSSKVKGFPYQLIKWQETEEQLKPFIEPFITHKQEDQGVILHSPSGYAIFTTGKLVINPNTKGRRKV
jgi:hypothetical protein